VTVTTTCAAEAYDYARVVQIVQQQVQAQAASYFSSNFVEVGSLQTTVAQATVTDARTGRLLLAVQAAGRWAYRFDQSLKRSLARVIAGKDVTQVRALLNNEAGVAAVNVSISGPSQNTLPSDDAKITIVLRD
jgi:VCBS repeat-containing protein